MGKAPKREFYQRERSWFSQENVSKTLKDKDLQTALSLYPSSITYLLCDLGRVTSSVEAFFFSFSICKLSFVPHPQPRGPNHKSNLERFYDSGKVKVPVT